MIKDILMARKIIGGDIKKTPLFFSKNVSNKLEADIYLKPENFQETGSFKIRGALNKIRHLTKKEREKGLITCSSGNHVMTLAFLCSEMKIPLVAVISKNNSPEKIKKIISYGTNLILTDNILKEYEKICQEGKLTPIHPFDDKLVIAGQGTIGLEILKEISDPDFIFVPVGGGGLISGIGAAVKSINPKTRIIAVEPEKSDAMNRSMKKKKRVHLKDYGTIAQTLNVPFIGEIPFSLVRKYVDDFILVSEREIVLSLKYIWENHKIKVEPAGAVSLAAVMFEKVKIPPKSKVVCLLTGENIEDQEFKNLIK